MLWKINLCIILVAGVAALYAQEGQASVLINEIFADPPAGLLGDANNDGVRSGTADEFIELMNFGLIEVNLSSWSLADSVSTRHIFPSNTVLAPNAFLVVFGGGSPVLPGVNWQTASSGGLGLNNDGDQVILFDADHQIIEEVIYGSEGGKDQSIARYPDGEGTSFILHSEIGQSEGALYSPGTGLNPADVTNISHDTEPLGNPAVPELPSFLYVAMGWGALLLKGKVRLI